ncbi:MAG: hypothetical protein R2785_12175 [Flavobacteriaceae bacterium]
MTYEEAVSLRNSVGASYLHDNDIYIPKVVPYKEKDEINFNDTLKRRFIDDAEMKSYSSDNKFKVRGYNTKFYPNLL